MSLQRAGIPATVYEAYPADAGGAGVFLTIAVNGLKALRAIDLEAPVKAAGFATAGIRFVSGTGKALGEAPLGGILADGTVAHTIRRADLHRVLYGEAERRGILVEHGKRLAGAEATPDGGVVARFEDGASAEGTLLIGADGIHSRTRRFLDSGAPSPRYSGLGNVGGYSRANVHDVPPGTYVMMFGRRAFFGYVVSPDGEVWWFANPPQPIELKQGGQSDTAVALWKARLMDLFAGDAGPAVDIVSQATSLMTFNQYDLAHVPVWSWGPMIIIGDAAHAASPTSGQGASLAIEDAVVLARCLRDLPDRAAAFAAFERARRPRVERIVAAAARMNRTKMPGPIGRGIRDLVVPAMIRHTARAQRWVFEYSTDWTESAA
jgi:2-polyprenyl-6-methoxyphenol hydroxylase-like FAD-dependent oxidoreductase